MAHIWVREDSQWAVLPLNCALFSLQRRKALAHPSGLSPDWEKEIMLVRSGGPSDESWILLAGAQADVRVNGIRLNPGIRSLRDCDEIRVAGSGLFFFSTECLAVVEPFAGSSADSFCPRCRQAMHPGHPSVKCPACGVWYHQSEDFPCWTYAETCALCPQATDMEAGYRWAPEEM